MRLSANGPDLGRVRLLTWAEQGQLQPSCHRRIDSWRLESPNKKPVALSSARAG